MSRLFDGVDDEMRFAPDGIALNGAWTMACLVDLTAANGNWQALIGGHSTSTTGQCGMGRKNTNNTSAFNAGFIVDSGSGTGTAHTILAADGWEVVVARRSSATGTVTFSKGVIGGAWSHITHASASTAGSSISGGHIRFSNWEASDYFQGYLAVAAIWDGTALTQTQVETLDNGTTQAWYDLSPQWLVDDSNAFATNLMTGTARTSITGTADDASDPSGWTYGIGGGGGGPTVKHFGTLGVG